MCTWHSGCDATLKQKDLFGSSVFDIEDLRRVAVTGHVGCC